MRGDTKEFIFWFHGRTLGAIGIFYRIGPFVGVGETRDVALERALVKAHKHHDLYSNLPVAEQDVTGLVGR